MTAVLEWLRGEKRGTFDDERAVRRLCSCGQHMTTGAAVPGCPWRREPIGKWGATWSQPERQWGAE